jgi:pyridoxal phosphate enzyme (YggS family)
MTQIRENIAIVQAIIADASARAGRTIHDVTLVAVSKTHPPEAILKAADAGLQHFGENRVEESALKIPIVSAHTTTPLTWHMIGHIQSRKAKEVAPLFQVVHSVDSLRLATKLAGALPEGGKLDVLIEMNVSGEGSKEGLNAANWQSDQILRERLVQQFREFIAISGLNVVGLMTMAPIVDHPELARPVFISLRGIRDLLTEILSHPLPHLSMGMTDDYEVAIEEGATMVRIGRAIFGERVR